VLKLKIRNFPPIRKESEIDLGKDFLIFVGPNNSGKTYVSQLIWGIFYKLLKIENIDFILQDLEGAIKTKDSSSKYLYIDDKILVDLERAINKVLSKEIPNIFGQNFVEKQPIDFEVEIDKKTLKEKIFLSSFNSDTYFGMWLEGGNVKKRKRSYKINIVHEKKDISPARLRIALILAIREVLIRPLLGIWKQFYLPAFRTSIPIFITKLIKAQGESIIERRFNERKRYTEPVERLIFDDLIELAEKQPKKRFVPTSLDNFQQRLEELLKGEIEVNVLDEVIPIPTFSYRTEEIELPMNLSSSMVNQLALFYVLYRHYKFHRRLFFIIDEPEIHLHPETKVRFAELLLLYVKLGNKLLITTHSYIFAKTLENYFLYDKLRKELPEKELKEIESYLFIDRQFVIDANKVGIYFFSGEEILRYQDKSFGLRFTDFAHIHKKITDTSKLLIETSAEAFRKKL